MIAFFRQVIGIKAFGIYTPAIITFALLATNQIKYGITIFVTVIAVGTVTRFFLKKAPPSLSSPRGYHDYDRRLFNPASAFYRRNL